MKNLLIVYVLSSRGLGFIVSFQQRIEEQDTEIAGKQRLQAVAAGFTEENGPWSQEFLEKFWVVLFIVSGIPPSLFSPVHVLFSSVPHVHTSILVCLLGPPLRCMSTEVSV